MLVELAQRIAAITPPEYVAARYGGNEFAVFLPGVAAVATVHDMALSLMSVCQVPVVVDAASFGNLSFSVGVALVPADNWASGLPTAQNAMQFAKLRGRARAVRIEVAWESP